MHHGRFHHAILTCVFLVAALGHSTAAQAATPADMISDYRLQHGEGKVKIDATLNRIARERLSGVEGSARCSLGDLAADRRPQPLRRTPICSRASSVLR